MRISRLKLKNWKNFRKVDVRLKSRVFIIGPNAAGKSNLLDSLRFLRDLVSPGGGFQQACIDRDGISKIRCLSSRESAITIEVELADIDEGKPLWRYSIEFAQETRGHRKPVILRERAWRRADGKLESLLNRPDESDREDPVRLYQSAIEQINANKPFRAIADFFVSIAYLHLVPQIVRGTGGISFTSGGGDEFGNRFLDKIATTPMKVRDARLRRINNALQIAVPKLTDLKLEADERGRPHLQARYQHWRGHGAKQHEKQFSDGTLRLIGLLWSLQESDGPLLLEEPELSLHPGLVQRLASLLYRVQKARPRQVILSTHSSELLSDKGIDSSETLLLELTDEGTEVHRADSIFDVKALLMEGLSIADAALPRTRPANLEQLVFKF